MTVTSADGTATFNIVVDVTGANDNASIVAQAGGDYAVTEAGGVANGTLGDPSASGTVIVSDVDAGEAHFQVPVSLAGTYGTFTFNATTGAWSYTLNDNSAATQALTAGQHVTDTLTVTSADGTATFKIGREACRESDNASIVAQAVGDNAVSEAGGGANGTLGDPSASGTVIVSDVDAGEAHFQVPVSLAGTYGTFTFNATTGAWTYTLNDNSAATQALTAGQHVTDTLTVTSADGTATFNIVVFPSAAIFQASIVAQAGGDYAVSEAGGVANGTLGDPSASGTVIVSDVDAGEAHFQVPVSLAGTYGTFTFNATTGAWTYTLNDNSAATQALTAGQHVTDTLTVTSADGTATFNIVVDVTGANDNASIVAQAGGDYAVTEAGGVANGTLGDPSASGTVIVSDVDAGEAHFQVPVSLAGTYGTFTFNATTGAWTYTLNDNSAATQALTAGQHVTDTLTVTSADGTATFNIVVDVTGANDNASIVAQAGGDYAVTEAGGVANGTLGDPSASGTVIVSDVDAGEAHFHVPVSLAGSFPTLPSTEPTGAWTYTLNDNSAATQALTAG